MAAQFVVPLLLLVFCTWKGEQRKFGAIVGLASTKPKRCCKPKCESVFTLWSVICSKVPLRSGATERRGARTLLAKTPLPWSAALLMRRCPLTVEQKPVYLV